MLLSSHMQGTSAVIVKILEINKKNILRYILNIDASKLDIIFIGGIDHILFILSRY